MAIETRAILSCAVLLTLLGAGCGESPRDGAPSAGTGGSEVVAITDGRAFLAELESRLRTARSIRIETVITSRGVHPSSFEGTVSMDGPDAAWQLLGAFGGSEQIDVSLHADANHMHGGSGPRRFDRAAPPALRDALVTALVRMGLLHDCALLVGGEGPEMRATHAGDWIVLDDVTVGDSTLIDSEFATPIHVHLRVAGEPMGEATLWIDEARRLPVRRDQTVVFPEGEMHVVERYTTFAITD